MGFPYGGPPPPAPPVNVEPEMQVPRRFKTAFIFFSSARHKEIKHELAKEGKTEKVSLIGWVVFVGV